MSLLRLEDLQQFADVLRTRQGEAINVRFAAPRDAEELQHYFRSLSTRSRYNRFFGAISELPIGLLHDFLRVGERDRFTILATTMVDGFETIVAEARYALHAAGATLEFGLSVADRWQGRGIAAALMANLQCRAAALGALQLFGDTLRANQTMVSLARKRGFSFVNHPDDWKLVRFVKEIELAPQHGPCANWRLAALSRQATIPSAQA